MKPVHFHKDHLGLSLDKFKALFHHLPEKYVIDVWKKQNTYKEPVKAVKKKK